MNDIVALDRVLFSGARTSEPEQPHYLADKKLQVATVVSVRFMPANRVLICDTSDLPLKPRDTVVVETDKGIFTGKIIVGPRRELLTERPKRRVLRVATDEDVRYDHRHQFKQEEAYQFCLQRIRARDLPMKLVSVKYLHTGHKAVFYFSAEGRIDFRELVRDLAQRFRIRIEMRQIGIRDEAKIIGGIGPCGLQTCCSKHLQNFSPVTIKMAKTQNLVLNPQKVSGICGRLMCCLSYENKMYDEMRRELPGINQRVKTSMGMGTVKGVQVIGKRVKVLLESGEFSDFHISDLEGQEAKTEDDERRRPRRERKPRSGEERPAASATPTEKPAAGTGESESQSERPRRSRERRRRRKRTRPPENKGPKEPE